MIPGNPFRERYHDDPRIAAIVNQMVSMLWAEDITAHDLARCAVLAAQIYAERHGSPIVLVLRDDDEVPR